MAHTRTIRSLGNGSYGIALPIDDLRSRGLVDEDGDLVDSGQQVRLIDTDGGLRLEFCQADPRTAD